MSTPDPDWEATLNPSEVQVGTSNGPGIWVAPAGTEAPDDTSEDYEDPWRILGYLSDDGPTVGSSTDTEDITPWQSVVPLRSVITGRSVTLQFVLWQLNQITLAMYFDADEPETEDDGTIDMELRTDSPQHLHAISIDSADAERAFRITFGRASLTSAGDMQITRGAAVPLDCTLAALDDGGVLGRVQLGPRGTTAASLSAPARARRAAKAKAKASTASAAA
jgi:hypothetical protein